MKKIKIILAFLLVVGSLVSCLFVYSEVSKTPIPIESNFPLKRALTIPFDDVIEKLAVSDTWFAVATANKITAIDIDTQKTLWSIDFSFSNLPSYALEIIDNKVIAVREDQIILVDKTGQKKEIKVSIPSKQVII